MILRVVISLSAGKVEAGDEGKPCVAVTLYGWTYRQAGAHALRAYAQDGGAQLPGTGSVVVTLTVGGVAPGIVATGGSVGGAVGYTEVVFHAVGGDVDGVAGSQGESTGDPGGHVDAPAMVKDDVGTARGVEKGLHCR